MKGTPDELCRVMGHRFVSLIVPVIITIVSVVWSCTYLSPLYLDGSDSTIHLVFNESGSSSIVDKAGASILNALVIIGVIVLLTFIILALYKCNCGFVLYAWLMFSAASTFFLQAWLWVDLVFSLFQIPCDFVTMGIFILNFGVVGVLSLFYYSHPMLAQFYLIVVSVLIAWLLTAVPEWTTWCLLLGLAVYDIVAVLCPGGPLKMLIDSANARNEPIPGFVYDSANTVAVAVERPSRGAADGNGDASTSPLLRTLRNSTPFKLGLGDFIFYGLLVGRASFSGFVTWTFCLVAILSGMVGTLTILFLYKDSLRALPALPFSIFIGTGFFLLCLWGATVLESYVIKFTLVL
ncbi:presenilin 1 [Strigomonas culicis]|uniref:Presenilin n=1 Tax=Strigomonas culicis TaxID=28005 RepID=S9VDK2_9TRYP|nr:presenilin 1 [Strigomonas culicis]|eukprot:EPY21110.1 presenilin 1 [Strigomonas culicis]